MKRFIVLFCIWAFFIGTIIYISTIAKATISVNVSEVANKELSITVLAAGRVEEAEKSEVYPFSEAIVKRITAQEGEYIKKGSSIMEFINGEILVSPVSGFIRLITAREGLSVFSYSPVAVISDMKRLIVKANVAENQISKVKTGQAAQIECAANPGVMYSGVVSQIAQAAKLQANGRDNGTMVEVQLELSGRPENLKSGYSAEVNIITQKKPAAITVPYEAVRRLSGKNIVWTVKNAKAYSNTVELGEELEQETEITQGLSNGQRVIINPPDNLKNGCTIKEIMIK